MKCVYLLQSISRPSKRYVGITTDLDRRLAGHNSGKSPHTSRFKPWRVVVSLQFADEAKAEAFEFRGHEFRGHTLISAFSFVTPTRDNASLIVSSLDQLPEVVDRAE